jgi:hypothetical protein
MRLARLLTALFIFCAAAGPPESAGIPPLSGGEGGAEVVEKWNSYVDLANELETLFLPALSAYLETFGHSPEYQPIQGSGLIANYFLVLMESPEDFSRTLERAGKAAADQGDELDRAVQELVPYLEALWADLGRSRNWHLSRRVEARENQDETGELRARLDSPEEVHARIFASYQGFAATYERFRAALTRAGQARRQKDIQVLREKGLVIQPALLEILDAGQSLQDYLNVRQVSGAAPVKPEELRPFLDRLESVAKTLETARASGREGLASGREGLAAGREGLASGREGLAAGREDLSEEALVEFCDQLQVVRAEAGALAGDGKTSRKSSPESLALALGRLVDIYNLME